MVAGYKSHTDLALPLRKCVTLVSLFNLLCLSLQNGDITSTCPSPNGCTRRDNHVLNAVGRVKVQKMLYILSLQLKSQISL